MRYENWVLLNELIKVELPPWKNWKADVSSVSPSSERSFHFFRSDEGLTLETSAFQTFTVVIRPLSTRLKKPNFKRQLKFVCRLVSGKKKRGQL